MLGPICGPSRKPGISLPLRRTRLGPAIGVPHFDRSEDHPYSHKSKHAIALQEVIVMGGRLSAAIGADRVRSLVDLAESGGLVDLREAALYTENVSGSFLCPHDRIGRTMAREILLLALEVWDDRLVGNARHTYALDGELIAMFYALAAARSGEV